MESGMLLVGTRKGVFTLTPSHDRTKWALEGPMFLGHIAQHVVLDPRDGRRMMLAAHTGHLGPTVLYSDDRGSNWTEASKPPAFHAGDPLGRAVATVFWISPGHASEPDVWFAGGSPQGLFVTNDGGDTWEPVDGWNDHPMWETWAEWPDQNTPDGSMLHSVIIDPRDAQHMYIGLSSGGVFETVDRCENWKPLNGNVALAFKPEGDVELEFGHDPHCVRMHPANPDRLYQQNHCGIYRLDRPEERWVRIGDNMPTDIGDIGFPIEMHPRDPDTVWVFPMDGTDVWPRTSPDGRPAVFVSHDAGTNWIRQDVGLPERAWFTVKRQAMTTDTAASVGVYFATTSGEVWASIDEGSSWQCIAAHLPDVYSLEFAQLP